MNVGTIGMKRRFAALIFTISLSLAGASLLLQGLWKDPLKQDFVNGMLSLIDRNQPQLESAENGRAAFTAYRRSGFSDLESAAAAGGCFVLSSERGAQSLQDLQALEKPDGEAAEIADAFRSGIEAMNRGNSIFAAELKKAPSQSAEERSEAYQAAAEAMGLYLEGMDSLISSCEMLRDYADKNGLDGLKCIHDWIDRFTEEKVYLEEAAGG